MWGKAGSSGYRGRIHGEIGWPKTRYAALGAILGLVLIAATATSSASASECTDRWVGPVEGSWTTAASWSANHAPTESDVACIGSGKTVNLKSGGTKPVNGIQGEGTLVVRESTLNVLGTTEVWQIGTLQMEYLGNLGGPATVAISKALSWSGQSTMSGPGKTVLEPSSVNTIGSGNVSYTLSGRRLVNEGTVTQLTYSTLKMVEGGVFENLGTYNENGEKSPSQVNSSGAGSGFLNKGTFQKAEGTGTAKISSDFESQGTVRTVSGLIKFEGAHAVVFGDAGQIEGLISCEKSPTVTLNTFSAPKGEIRLREALVVVPAGKSPAIGTVTMDYEGNISGAGTLEITKALSWVSQSTMKGAGTTVIKPLAEATVTTYSAGLAGRSLINDGTFTLEKEGKVTGSEGALIENYGTLYLNSVESYARFPGLYGGSAARLVNYGTIEKSVGESKTRLDLNVDNFGAISAVIGTMYFNAKGSTAIFESGSSEEGSFQVELTGIVGDDFRMPTGTIKARESPIFLEGESSEIANLTIEYETKISGPGDLEIAQSFNWSGQSTVGGSGTMVLGPTSKNTLNSGATTATLSERRLENRGTFTQTASSRLNLTGSATFVNQGTYNLNSEPYPLWVRPLIKSEGAGPGLFANRGSFRRTEGSAKALVTTSFENSGSIVPKSSSIEFEHPVRVKASTATPHRAKCEDPVDCGTGNFTESQTDFAIGGRGVGLDLTRTYSAQAAAAGSLGIFGYGWTNSFGDILTSEEAGAKETLTDSFGATITFTDSGTAWIAPSWSTDALTGSAESGFTLTLRDQTEEKFDGFGRLESMTDRNGNETVLAYNGLGKLETITDPSGRNISLTYNGEGLVEKTKDPMGHEVKYDYESKQLKSVTLPGAAGVSWQYNYDASHRMTSFTDGRGGKTTNEYDSSNRVIAQTDPAERKATWIYEGFHTIITNQATGAVTDEWFNSNNQPTLITRGFGTPDAGTESFSYTAAGLLVSKTNGNGDTTTYGYDGQGNRTSERDAEGDEAKWTFNGAHQLLTATTPSGEKTTLVRDASGNPETISRPAPESKIQTVSFACGPHGEVEEMTDPLGAAWSYEYDSNGDRTAVIDPEGDKRTWAYDEDSRPISSVSPRGNELGTEPIKFTTAVERDLQGRPLTVIDPLGGTTKYTYDANGNVESVTDPNGRTTKFSYDAANELTKVERASGAVEETAYDGAGEVTSQTDGLGRKSTYVRNVLEQAVETIDPLERKTTRTFDAAGNLKTLEDPEGRMTTYGYDKADRLTGISFSDGITPNATFAYDEDGSLTSMVDGTGTSTYEYDQLDRLTHNEDGNGDTVGWEYNLGDQAVGLRYPNGKSISRAYDEDGRLESVTDWLGHTTSFAYNADSAPTLTTYPVATTDADEYFYDRADRVAGVTMKKGAETLASLAYTRDPAGQVESLVSKGLPGAEAESFSYDENERLTKAGAAEYGYDAANNLTKAPGTSNVFDKAGQLESATGATFTYDNEGERTKQTPASGSATTYGYDQAGSLMAVERAEEGETPVIAESFSYDGTGLVASRTVGLSTKHLTWDVSEAPEAVLSDEESSYLYGPDGLAFEQISSGEVPIYLHHDQLGSTRLLTDGPGETIGTSTYGPFGAPSGMTGTASTALGYAGQYTLGQSGLQYLRARFYDPATAQFLTADPIAAITRSPYFYANNNPLRFRDPSGLFTVGICASVSIGGFVIANGSACVQVSSSGDIGGTATGGVALGGGSGELEIGPGVQATNANHISELSGPFVGAGARGALIAGGYAEGFHSVVGCQGIGGALAGPAAGFGFGGYVGATDTVQASVNVPTFVSEVAETLGELGNTALEGLGDVNPF